MSSSTNNSEGNGDTHILFSSDSCARCDKIGLTSAYKRGLA
jgi:hypothetical protein